MVAGWRTDSQTCEKPVSAQVWAYLGVCALAVFQLKCLKDVLDSINAVAVEQKIEEVDGVLLQASLFLQLLYQVALFLDSNHWVEQEIAEGFVVLQQRLQYKVQEVRM